jgi:hypothetical protein
MTGLPQNPCTLELFNVSILKNGESNMHIAVWELNGTSTNLEESNMEEI